MQPFRKENWSEMRSRGFAQADRSLWVPATKHSLPTKSHRRTQEFPKCVRCHLRLRNDLSLGDYPKC
jgi:hypothetical protein